MLLLAVSLRDEVLRVWVRRIPFRVDIAGIIEIMGSSLYSRMDTPIRELIQNAHDAVMRRRNRDLSFRGRIDIRQDPEQGTLSFSDDGVGLNAQDAEQYLGTLGIGITGLLKGRGSDEQRSVVHGDAQGLIGQFGIGLFSAFMLADSLRVESRREDCDEAICWEAGPGTEIQLSSSEQVRIGTTVTLKLKPQFRMYAESPEVLETAIREFADFLNVPIHLNDSAARINVISVAWFEPTPDPDSVELALANYFSESPLDVIPIRIEKPLSIAGALYISPQRTPGFADEATVAVTIRRMVISRRVRDLLPSWGSFFRGVLELEDSTPTASREDLVRDDRFRLLRATLEEFLFTHLETMAEEQPARLEAIVSWHRYHFAGAALSEAGLRQLMRKVYRFSTSQGPMLLDEILQKSVSDAIHESDAEFVIWYNADRRQERYLDELFARVSIPCVHTCRSFEESLLAAMIADQGNDSIDLRQATPSSPNFAVTVMGMADPEDVTEVWGDFFRCTEARVMLASFQQEVPVAAFLNERYELAQTFEDLRREGDIPQGFQRLIDAHFRKAPAGKNEVVLNREHRLVQRALRNGPRSPLASVLRLLVLNSLTAAGAGRSREASGIQNEDLDWIADALWGQS
jgi:HSP90 family molecular chaperone